MVYSPEEYMRALERAIEYVNAPNEIDEAAKYLQDTLQEVVENISEAAQHLSMADTLYRVELAYDAIHLAIVILRELLKRSAGAIVWPFYIRLYDSINHIFSETSGLDWDSIFHALGITYKPKHTWLMRFTYADSVVEDYLRIMKAIKEGLKNIIGLLDSILEEFSRPEDAIGFTQDQGAMKLLREIVTELEKLIEYAKEAERYVARFESEARAAAIKTLSILLEEIEREI